MFYIENNSFLKSFIYKSYGDLEPGKRYRVIKKFKDLYGTIIDIGWKGRYKAYYYLAHDDGLSLAFDTDKGICVISLQMWPELHKEIGDNLLKYFQLDE